VPITFRCSDCTQKLRIEDEFAGKKVACVRCGSKQRVPHVSSPEFSQSAVAPSEPAPPAPPARPTKESKPAKREPASHEATQREPSRYEPPRRPPIWFQPVELDEITPPPTEPEPPQPQSVVSKPLEPEPISSEPIVSKPDVSEWAAPQPTLPAPVRAQQGLPHEIRPQSRVPAPHARRAAAAHAESSLVPPYKKLDVEELIDMTAMVDIVFFLLIFFLVTSMHALDSTIPMPAPDPQKGAAREPRSVAAIDSDDSYVVVRVDRNDKITVEGSEVRSDRELLFKLRDLRLGSAHPEKLLVVGHGDATHGTVVMVLDAGRELGMDQVRLTVQDEVD
jgi:biopolymer transport protein ExbD